MATHYVARELLALGHNVRQVPPANAKPFIQWLVNAYTLCLSALLLVGGAWPLQSPVIHADPSTGAPL